ncbi:MAG: chlorite dismutase family protein [Pyrinomonadaceae bacterium]
MELLNFQKDPPEQGSLRLVAEPKEPHKLPEIEKQFVNFMFFRVNPDWRKLDTETKDASKREFRSVYDSFHEHFLLYSYSLIGFDSKADIMLWRVGQSLDLLQEMTSKLFRTKLGSYLETAETYLAATKKMMFVSNDGNSGPQSRLHVVAGSGKYHFVYPCAKCSDWRDKTGEECDALIEEKFMVGKKFPNIKIHLTHAFGFGEQEYLLSFETDEPKDFLALAEELRQMPAGKFTLGGMPGYTCRQRSLTECLDALG